MRLRSGHASVSTQRISDYDWSMPRRRARETFWSELPISVSKIDSLAFETLPLAGWMDASTTERLKVIARDYALGRQLERARTKRPDARRTMEVLAASARSVQASARLASLSHRMAIYEALKHSWSLLMREDVSTSDVCHMMEALAERPGIGFVETQAVHLELVACLERLADQLLNLPMDCEWSFSELQQYALLYDADWPAPDAIEKFAERIAVFAELATELMKSDRGPHSSHVQMRTVQALMREFEHCGRTATHCVTAVGEYSAMPLSEFGKFVHAFFHAIEPNQRLRQGISEALEHVCWPTRHVRKQAQVDEARRNRRDLIETALARQSVTIIPFFD